MAAGHPVVLARFAMFEFVNICVLTSPSRRPAARATVVNIRRLLCVVKHFFPSREIFFCAVSAREAILESRADILKIKPGARRVLRSSRAHGGLMPARPYARGA